MQKPMSKRCPELLFEAIGTGRLQLELFRFSATIAPPLRALYYMNADKRPQDAHPYYKRDAFEGNENIGTFLGF